MVVEKSPEWLPSGFTEKVKYKNGRKIKYYLNVATGAKYHSKKDVLRCATEDNGLLGTPQTKICDDNGISSDNKVEAISVVKNDSAAWLPNGWILEERTRQSGSSKGLVYKVYTDLSSGSKFYSKAAVTRYLNIIDHANTVTEPNIVGSVGPADTMTEPNKKRSGSFTVDPADNMTPNKIDNVDEPSTDMSPQFPSMTNTGGVQKKKRKGNSFVTVAIESSTDNDLPPGWIKEIKTSKSGNRMRKDPYYTDPISGYVFRSKLDALRYLKTNDIGSCVCRPLKRQSDDVNSIENKIPSSNPANEKLNVRKSRRLLGGELNGGGETSGIKILAESKAKTSKQKQGKYESDSAKATSVRAVCLEEKISSENSEKNAETVNKPEPENDVFNEDARAMAVDVAIGSPLTDTLTKQQLSESGNETKVKSSKSKKRRDLSFPLRTSKRLAGSQLEMPSNSDLNERSLRAAARSSHSEFDKSPSFSLKDSASIPPPSDIEPAKEAADAVISEATRQDIDLPNEVENLPNEVEKPTAEGAATGEQQSNGKASEKQLDDGKRSQETELCYDFGDSWSDPLEFALKTLRGEISIDDTLTFPSCFNEPISTPCNQPDGCLKQSQSDAPVIFQNEFAPRSESSKQQSAVDPLPANSSSFSVLGNMGFPSFGGFNCQSSSEFGKKDSQEKLKP